ncbi:hypothetical protein [uncultured Nitrosomonas sp.]|uniref:hypothetical protein n=1 Tax=uncultured Nitrosomonas sp. TaxID=156424 RepID=UPI00261E3765|nr:hypothetical protein [uncultured Nitrosomonas sp.]
MSVPAEVAEAPHIKELQEENELLLSQLHLVQEELEKYYLRNKELESGQAGKLQNTTPSAKGWVDDELPDALAENRRLQTLVEVQQKIHQLETHNTLNVRLGNMLIESAASSGSLLSVPGKLRKIWKEENQQTPPKALGGKGFDKIIAAYGEGGFDAVERLIAVVSISPAMQASALTALARHLMKSDSTQAAEAARRAYALDPRPFRLKWLAFRLHEAGEIAEAEAMLAILPADTPFSDSETRQASQVRSEAKHIRQRAAKQQTTFFERRAEIDKQLNALAQERDKQSKLATERSAEIEQCNQKLNSLQQTNGRLEQEKSDQIKRCETAEKRIEACDSEIAALKQEHIQSQQENELLLKQMHQVQEDLERYYLENKELVQGKNELSERLTATAEQIEANSCEIAALVQQCEAAERLAGEREGDNATLKEIRDRLIRECTRLEQEKAALAEDYAKQTSLTEARQAQIIELTQAVVVKEAEQARAVETLQQVRAQLETENSTLTQQCETVKTLIREREREIETLKQAHEQRVQEKSALVKQQKEIEERAAEQQSAIKALEQEKAAQTKQRDEAEKLAAERLKQINELKQKIQNHQSSEAESAASQQRMQEEMARAEAQLDLIKDMLLMEPAL